MKVTPLKDRIIVRRLEAKEKTAGGLYIPDNAKERPQIGEVVSAGEGGRDEQNKLIPMSLKTGDRIMFGKYAGSEIKIDNEDLIIMREEDVLGIVTEYEG